MVFPFVADPVAAIRLLNANISLTFMVFWTAAVATAVVLGFPWFASVVTTNS